MIKREDPIMSTTDIFYTVEFNLNDGKLAEFEAIANKCIEHVRKNQLGMKSYEWYFNRAKTACFVNERHIGSESVLTHLENIAPLLNQLLQHARLARIDVFGSPNKPATEALEDLRANINRHWSGFTR